MNRYEFSLDPEAARKVGSVPRITETGAYRGILRDIYVYETKRGAAMLRIDFRDDEERYASMDICIKKSDGSDAFGVSLFHALMTVCKIRYTITQTCPNVPVFGDNHKQEVGRFMGMLNKRVGLLVRAVHDKTRDKYQDSIELVAPFDAETGQTAAEILDKADAKKLNILIAVTKDKFIYPKEGSAGSGSQESPSQASEQDDFEIPF